MPKPDSLESVSLADLGRGAAVEKFAVELERVLENIADPNTDAEAKRKITLTVTFLPNEDRDTVATVIDCGSKLAPPKVHGTVLFVGREKRGEPLVAIEQNQRDLFEDDDGELVDRNTGEVVPIDRKEGSG